MVETSLGVVRVGRQRGALDIDGRNVDMNWTGELYTGRTHNWQTAGNADPFRQRIDLDGLGRAANYYTAVDTDGNGQPINPAWGNSYCGGAWNADPCAAPLVDLAIKRDVLGRVRSLQRQYGNPEIGQLDNVDHPWRGYLYNAKGHLTAVYEQRGFDAFVPDLLPTHSSTNADVDTLATDFNGVEVEDTISKWDYQREVTVGGLTNIVNVNAGNSRWNTGTRDDGHQLAGFTTDGNAFTSTHDPYGRVTGYNNAANPNDDRMMFYGPMSRLAMVRKGDSSQEFYLYDAMGKLANAIDGKDQTFVYDGDQMIAALGPNSSPFWEAVWGDGVDQMIEHEVYTAGVSVRHVPLSDHRNSITAWFTEDTDSLVSIVEYTPNGRLIVKGPDGQIVCQEEDFGLDCVAEESLPAFGFNSAWRSEFSGLVSMRARWYSPRAGQFLTHDPLEYVDSYNLYGFVGFDPINGWDPYGTDSKGFVDGLFDFEADFTGVSPRDFLEVPYDNYVREVNRRVDKLKRGELLDAFLSLSYVVEKFKGDKSSRDHVVDLIERDEFEKLGQEAQVEIIKLIVAFLLQRKFGGKTPTMAKAPKSAKTGATKRVGRWMSKAEFEKMKETGKVQEGAGGVTYVADSGPSSFRKQAHKGSVYVEFDVPTNSLVKGGKSDWFKTVSENAGSGMQRMLEKQGGSTSPKVTNLSGIIEEKK